MKEHILRNITVKADELSNKYNKTKDPLIREEWYQLVRSLDSLLPSDTNIEHKVLKPRPDPLQRHHHRTK